MKRRLTLLTASLLVFAARAESVTLSWSESADSAVTGYNIYWGLGSGAYGNKASISGRATTTTTIPNSNFQTGVVYYFSATAYDGVGDESDYSNEIEWVQAGGLGPLPPDPLSISGTQASLRSYQAALTWNASEDSNVTSIHLYQRKGTGNFTTIDNVGVPQNSITVTGLLPGTSYYFIATGQYANGAQGMASNVVWAYEPEAGAAVQTGTTSLAAGSSAGSSSCIIGNGAAGQGHLFDFFFSGNSNGSSSNYYVCETPALSGRWSLSSSVAFSGVFMPGGVAFAGETRYSILQCLIFIDPTLPGKFYRAVSDPSDCPN